MSPFADLIPSTVLVFPVTVITLGYVALALVVLAVAIRHARR